MLQLLARDEAQQSDPDMLLATSSLTVELLSPEAAAIHAAKWRDLAGDCLEPNVFFEPGFALAAARHLARDRAPRFLFVWDSDADGRRQLLAVCPLAPSKRRARFLPTRIWTHEQAPLGTPLLDRARAEEALAAILAFCRQHLPHVAGLMFPLLPQDGPVARILTASAAAETRSIEIFGAHQRPILTAGADPKRYLEQSVGSGRRRKLNKARKALEAKGAVTLHIMRDPHELMAAFEEFLALEAKGWKGQRGTALGSSPERATFARDLAMSLSAEGKCFVASLDLDGKPVAMTLLLESCGRAFWWKIAYDEDFATISPGVLLALEMTRHLLGDSRIALTDSCAGGDHAFINHIWSERMAIADIFVAVSADRQHEFEAVTQRERLRRNLRARLKAIVLQLRKWQRGRRSAH